MNNKNKQFKFIVDINILRAAAVSQAVLGVRYYLCGIHFAGNRVESTNGHVAYMAVDKREKPTWFDGDRSAPKSIIIKINDSIPATTKKRNIIYAIIENDANGVIIRYMDFYGQQLAVGMGEIVDGRFPKIPKLIADHRRKEKVNDAIGVQAQYLAMLDKMTKNMHFQGVKMETFGKESAIIFSWKPAYVEEVKSVFITMPVRL